MSGGGPGRGSRTRAVVVIASVLPIALGVGTIPAAIDASGASRPPPPVQGKSVDVSPVSGTVLIRRPGESVFAQLTTGEQISVGSTVDTTHGRVRLTSARTTHGHTQTADFYQGAFSVSQRRGQALTTLRLTGGSLAACRQAGRAFAARHQPRRHLWGSGHGNFRTVGGYSSATSRGTIWLTADYCEGTLIQVRRGDVTVNFFGVTVTIHVGDSSISYCSPSGDTCTSVEGHHGDFTLGIGEAGPNFRRYRLCVTSPGGTTDCRAFHPTPKPDGFIISLISWRRHFPARGSGVYTVRWIDADPGAGGPLGPDLFFTVP